MPICQITGEEVPTLHEHHVIPREFGGVNSATVHISPSLHDAIHRAATNKKTKAKVLASYSKEVQDRVEMLITAIEESKAQLNPVASQKINISFSEQEWDKLSKLAKEMNMTIPAVAKKLLSNLLSRER